MFISPSMLERVYVRGSLKNTETGFEFKLKNNVDNGSLSGCKALLIDGAEVPLTAVTLKTPQGDRPAAEISSRSPLYLRYGGEVTISAASDPLPAGSHEMALKIYVMEIGQLEIKVTDEIA